MRRWVPSVSPTTFSGCRTERRLGGSAPARPAERQDFAARAGVGGGRVAAGLDRRDLVDGVVAGVEALAFGLVEAELEPGCGIGKALDRRERHGDALPLATETEGHGEAVLVDLEIPELVLQDDGQPLGVEIANASG